MEKKITNFLRSVGVLGANEVFDPSQHANTYVSQLCFRTGVSAELARASLHNFNILPERARRVLDAEPSDRVDEPIQAAPSTKVSEPETTQEEATTESSGSDVQDGGSEGSESAEPDQEVRDPAVDQVQTEPNKGNRKKDRSR